MSSGGIRPVSNVGSSGGGGAGGGSPSVQVRPGPTEAAPAAKRGESQANFPTPSHPGKDVASTAPITGGQANASATATMTGDQNLTGGAQTTNSNGWESAVQAMSSGARTAPTNTPSTNTPSTTAARSSMAKTQTSPTPPPGTPAGTQPGSPASLCTPTASGHIALTVPYTLLGLLSGTAVGALAWAAPMGLALSGLGAAMAVGALALGTLGYLAGTIIDKE